MTNKTLLSDHPYFCWDRTWSMDDIKSRLTACAPEDWPMLAAWIMREARFEDVWVFLKPDEIASRFGELKSFLGRKREFWEYILGAWHELGKL
jgi:hypothetical protein